MARPIYKSTSGVSVSTPAPLNIHAEVFAVSVAGVITGSATVSVQFTMDDPFAATFNPATATWFDHPDGSQTANFSLMFTTPVRAVRYNQTAGAGSCAGTIIQADW